jgi:hypothetical protein
MTTKQAIVQQLLLNNGSINKHVSTTAREYNSNGSFFFSGGLSQAVIIRAS